MVFVFCHVRHIYPHTTICRLTVLSLSLVLYILYFPPHLKTVTLDIEGDELRPSERVKTNLKSDTWRLSIILSWTVIFHLSVFVSPVQI
jgi:hypothetical protein